MTPPILVWFRRDLRLRDNPALAHAAASGRAAIPFFLLDEDERRRGGASRWWLHGSLAALADRLARLGSRLVLRRGAAAQEIAALVQETGAEALVWNRLYEPAAMARDQRITAQCRAAGLAVRSFNASLLREPWSIGTQSGKPYRVFTPFWRHCLAEGFAPPEGAPQRLLAPARWPASETLAAWQLRPSAPDWAGGLRAAWQPGEAGAADRLQDFLSRGVRNYAAGRDLPGDDGTGRLSPHLHFGEIGPRQIAAQLGAANPKSGAGAFLRQLGWREFSAHLLFHNPDLETVNLQRAFDRMPWRDAPDELRAWQRGRTGYPMVDAGMRQLWASGWMHNRVRMIAASFLTKHLLMDWRRGAAWFWDTLVDADLANNSAGWQWVAGSGADASPWFRIFNPIVQGQRFDAEGAYIRQWLPGLRRLPTRWIHAPWEAPPSVLAEAGVRLGETYPRPLVEHQAARRRALEIYETEIRAPV